MRLSSMEGGFSQVHQILTAGVFLTVLALALGASPWHIGLIAAVPFEAVFARAETRAAQARDLAPA